MMQKTISKDITQVGRLPIEQTLNNLREAAEGDAILLQASCHNPTGLDFSPLEWDLLAQLCVDKQLTPYYRYGLSRFRQGFRR